MKFALLSLIACTFLIGCRAPQAESSYEFDCICGTPEAALEPCLNPLCAAGKNNPENPDCACGTLNLED
jgi:hypothetical protein